MDIEVNNEENQLVEKSPEAPSGKKNLLFSADDALRSFCVDFLSREKISEWVISRLHPDGPFCPACGSKITDETTMSNFLNLKRCRCKGCKKWFSALNGTALHHAGLDVVDIFFLGVCLRMKVDRDVIAEILKCHPDTVKLWQMKFEAAND